MKARMHVGASDDWESTAKHLKTFVERDPAASYDIIVREQTNTLEMLILQSSEMKKNLHQYPELVQLDGTYRLENSRSV